MPEDWQFEALLDALYGAAIDPQNWPLAHSRFVEYLGAGVGHMNFFDWDNGGQVIKAVFKGIDPSTQKLLADPAWAGRDPFANAIFGDHAAAFRIRSEGGVFQGADSIPPADYVKTDFYQEVGRSIAIDHLTVAGTHGKRFSIGLSAHTGNPDGFSEAQKAKANRLLPHLKRAFDLYMRNFESGALLTGTPVWESFSAPVFVFAGGKLRFRNEAAELALATSGLFRHAPGARPILADVNAQSALDDFLSAANDSSAPRSHVRICTCVKHKRWLLQLVRIRSPADPLADVLKLDRHLVLATLMPLDDRTGRDATIATFSQLTPGEREVLTHIANGLSPHDIAERTGRRLETVRWYIKGLTGKLEARGFADLARLAGMVLPLKAELDATEEP